MTFTEKYGNVSLGYSEDMSRNDDWEEMGLCCPFEHCIENSGFESGNFGGYGRCPVFGHDCPGGEDQVAECEETNDPWVKLHAKITGGAE